MTTTEHATESHQIGSLVGERDWPQDGSIAECVPSTFVRVLAIWREYQWHTTDGCAVGSDTLVSNRQRWPEWRYVRDGISVHVPVPGPAHPVCEVCGAAKPNELDSPCPAFSEAAPHRWPGMWVESDRLAEAIAGEIETWQAGGTGASLEDAVTAELGRYRARSGLRDPADTKSEVTPRPFPTTAKLYRGVAGAARGRIIRAVQQTTETWWCETVAGGERFTWPAGSFEREWDVVSTNRVAADE